MVIKSIPYSNDLSSYTTTQVPNTGAGSLCCGCLNWKLYFEFAFFYFEIGTFVRKGENVDVDVESVLEKFFKIPSKALMRAHQ